MGRLIKQFQFAQTRCYSSIHRSTRPPHLISKSWASQHNIYTIYLPYNIYPRLQRNQCHSLPPSIRTATLHQLHLSPNCFLVRLRFALETCTKMHPFIVLLHHLHHSQNSRRNQQLRYRHIAEDATPKPPPQRLHIPTHYRHIAP